MTSNLFIVYRITNIVERKHYYGYKSCGKRDPKEIIGKTYFSSSSDKEFIEEQKNHPERFRYKIVARFSTKEEAFEREILLHRLFDVGANSSFYNKVKQTSSGFDTSGKAIFILPDGKRELLVIGSPEALRYKRLSHTTSPYMDDLGNIHWTNRNDKRVVNGQLRHIRKNKASVLDTKTGKTTSIDVGKFKESNGEFVGVTAGKKTVMNKETGIVECIDKQVFSSEIYEEINRDMVVCRDESGNFLRVRRDDERLVQRNIVGVTRGYIRITNGVTNKSIHFSESIPEGWHKGVTVQKNICIHKDNKEKYIGEADLESHITSGWSVGRSKSRKSTRGRVLMNDGEKTIAIEFADIESYKILGYQMGRNKNKNSRRGKSQFIRGSESVFVDRTDTELIERLYAEGWQRPSPPMYNSGRLTVNNGKDNKMIPKEELDNFLADGWQHGKVKKRSS